MVAFLKQFLGGHCDTKTLRETFDHKTRNEWRKFGFKGMSGAMFLNTLVKHITDQVSLSAQLREVLQGLDRGERPQPGVEWSEVG